VTRAVAIVGSALFLAGAVVFAWKILALDLPVVPAGGEGLWRIELDITARGAGRRGSVRAALPSSSTGQVVFDERTASEGLVFTIRTEEAQRMGVWSGRLRGVHHLAHGFRVQLDEVRVGLPASTSQPPPVEIAARHGVASPGLPSDAHEVREQLERIGVEGGADPAARARMLFAYVVDEVAGVDSGSDDAILTLEAHEGSPLGKTRALVTLLRAAGIPARIVAGLELFDDATPESRLWAQAWIAGSWIPMSATREFFGQRPGNFVTLRVGASELVESTSVDAVGYRYHALRERLRQEELASLMLPPSPFFERLSLYRLPVPTQSALRAILLLPLGALVVTVFRNLVGVPTFGTFMPVLIAFALRETSLGPGLALVCGVLALGIAGRLTLERLRLLLVPRLSILLCVVVLAVVVMALLGRGGGGRDFYTGVLFPLVILTMLIERFSVTIAEEGLRAALVRAGYSVLVAVAVYPVFQSSLAEHLMFGFPELVVCVIGVLVLIGGYTGYRISDLIRFRLFAQQGEVSAP
jgi:hypothetical protein